MSKRLTQDCVEKQVAKEGYRLISEYEQAKKPITLICPGGHEWVVYFHGFKAGKRCGYCTGKLVNKAVATEKLAERGYTLIGEYRATPRKITVRCRSGHIREGDYHRFLKNGCGACAPAKQSLGHKAAMQRFRDAGFTVVSENPYKNNATKFDVLCSEGHKTKKSVGMLPRGCRVCAGQYIDYGMVKEGIESVQGYSLLSTSLESAVAKLSISCDQQHTYTASWNNFQQGGRCSVCAGYVSHDFVNKAFVSEGWQLLDHYEKSHTPMRVVCSEGHSTTKSWSAWQNGQRCAMCDGQIVTHEQVERMYAQEGYTLLTKYKNKNTKVKYRCPEGHERWAVAGSFKQGCRCGECADRGFNQGKPGTLYYIAFNHPDHPTPLYKIGITNRTVQERFAPEPTPYRIIHTESYLFGFLAYEKEQRILAQHAAHKYTGANLLVSGNTELFTTDILNLDKAAHKQSPLPDRRSA
jgi:hypothetical protein